MEYTVIDASGNMGTCVSMIFVSGPDMDSDEITDVCDNCPNDVNPEQEDSDADSVGDACDQCPGADDRIDEDGDGRPDCLTNITAYVWGDLDGDGRQENAEPGLAGVQVNLISQSTGDVLDTRTTNEGGEVFFLAFDLPVNNRYRLEFIAPQGHRITLKDQGNNDNRDSDANRNNGRTPAFFLAANGRTERWDAGMWSPGEVESFVWADLDGDGRQDSGEPGVPNVLTRLLNSDGLELASATSDENGLLRFANVPADESVRLFFAAPLDAKFTQRNIGNDNRDSDVRQNNGQTPTFSADRGGQVFTSWDAGLWTPGTIEAFVWNDLDEDGRQDDDEPGLSGARVELLESNGDFIAVSYTNPDGLAIFTEVPADRRVRLRFFELPGTSFTQRDRGNDRRDSDPKPNTGLTARFQADRAAERFTSWDAGLTGTPIRIEVRQAPQEEVVLESTKEGIDRPQVLEEIGMKVYPNPFVQQTTVQLVLPQPVERGLLEIYDLQGRRVHQLHMGSLGAGIQQFNWAGNDLGGTNLPSGIYLVRLLTKDQTVTRKVSLLR